MAVSHLAVVCSVLDQNIFVAFVEGITDHAPVVVEDGAPASLTENTGEFAPRALQIEPVHRLTHGNQIDRAICEAGCLGGSLLAVELRILRGQGRARIAHLLVWFDGNDLMATREKDLR